MNESIRDGYVSLSSFYLNRAFRLWPALICVSLFAFAFTLAIPALRATLPRVIIAVLYLSDFAGAADHYRPAPQLLGHTWSLSIEEHFYIVWAPILVWLLLRRRVRPNFLAAVTAGLALLPTAERWLIWRGPVLSYNRIYFAFDTRADGLLLGCTLALVAQSVMLPRWNRAVTALRVTSWAAIPLLAVIAFLIPTAVQQSGPYSILGLLVVNICAATLVATVAFRPEAFLTRLLSTRLLSWSGRNLSYALYLWHIPILFVVPFLIGGNRHVAAGIAVMVSIFAAVASWALVERPVNRWRRSRLANTRGPGPGPTLSS